MKQLTIFFIAVSLIFSFGCSPRVRTYTYEKAVPPDNIEGKQCCLTCKQIQIQAQQLAQLENKAKTDEVYKDIAYAVAEANYNKCVIDCGGTIETKTTTY